MGELTQREVQWLLSLSELSLLGPQCDLDAISTKGILGKFKSTQSELELCIFMNKEPFLTHKSKILRFLEEFSITNALSFEGKIVELLNGSQSSKNIEQLVLLMKLMDHNDYDQKKMLCVNGYTFSQSIKEYIKNFEFHWPKEGFLAYDLANTIMLLRLGVGLGYIDTDKQKEYFEQIFPIAKSIFISYQQFGQDATIGRNIHIHHLKNSRNNDIVFEQKGVFAMAYYGIWENREFLDFIKQEG